MNYALKPDVKALVKAGVATAKGNYPAYLNTLKSALNQEHVANSSVYDIVDYAERYIANTTPSPNDILDSFDNEDFGDPAPATPESQVIGQLVDNWLAEKEGAAQFRPLWRQTTLNGEAVYAVSTWRMSGPYFEWNYAGKEDAVNSKVIHLSGPDLLWCTGQVPLCVIREVEFEIKVGFKRSSYYGTTQKVQGHLFVWVIRRVPGRSFRFWLSEIVRGQARKDIKTWNSVVMV
jgi:hypothetical protein